MLYFLSDKKNTQNKYTVKPLLTTTPQQRPPLNYDHLFLEQNIFSILFNGHIHVFLNCDHPAISLSRPVSRDKKGLTN